MTDEPREQETVTGTVGGINQKGDKWQVEVTPAGSQYGRKLWTKSETTRDACANLYGRQASFLCNVSHWTNQQGQPVRSLWIDTVQGDSGVQAEPAGPSGPVTEPRNGSYVASRDETRVSIERQTALKAAVELWSACVPAFNESPAVSVVEDAVLALAERFALFLEHGVIRQGDDPEIPF